MIPIMLVKKTVNKAVKGNWGTPTESKYQAFAEILPPIGGFRTYEAQTQLGQVRKFKTRFRFDLHPGADWKIEARGKQWTVQDISQDEEKQFFWIITANHK